MINNHAKYTVVLSEVLKDNHAKALINEALSVYPLYTPTSENEYIPRVVPTREELNTALLNHYKYREIGFETVGRFIDELKIAMCEIMPFYNQILFTQDQDYNIIYNVDYKRTIDTGRTEERINKIELEGSSESESSAHIESSGNATTTDKGKDKVKEDKHGKSIEADTPANLLNIKTKDIDSVDYASMARWSKDENETESESDRTATSEDSGQSSSTADAKASSNSTTDETGKTTGTEKTLETTKGNFGVVSAQDLVMKYRETIRNTVQDIINDERIQELFMLVY